MRITKEFKLKGAFITCVLALVFMLFGVFITTGRSGDSINSSNNAEIMATSGLSVEADETETVGVAGEIYASGSSGSDANDGSSASTPVSSISRILELLPDGGVVNVLSSIVISSDLTLSPTSQITFRRTTEGLGVDYGAVIDITGSNTTVEFNNITFDGASLNSDTNKCLVTISATTANVTFGENIIIENNNTYGVTALSDCENLTLVTEDVEIRNCFHVQGYGFFLTHVFAYVGKSDLTFSGLYVHDNGSYGFGGAICISIGGTISGDGVVIKDSYFVNNDASYEDETKDTYRSIIHVSTSNNKILVDNCIFEKNSSKGSGGCIFVTGNNGTIYSGHTASVTNCQFINNSMGTQGRGLIFSSSIDTFNVEDCYFEGNTGEYRVGIEVTATNNVNFKNLQMVGNAGHSQSFIVTTSCYAITADNVDFTNHVGSCLSFSVSNNSLELEITNCDFTNIDLTGGDVDLIRSISGLETLTMSNCNFTNCVANYNSAAAISIVEVASGFTLNMSNCNFDRLELVGSPINIGATTGTYNFNDCNFTNNSASGSNGGVISFNPSAAISNFHPTFNNCEFGYNSSEGEGGAIYTGSNYTGPNNKLTLIDCYIHNNSASNGGGIRQNGGAYITISGGVFENNVAKENGGFYRGDNVTISNAIVRNNSAGTGNGGGIFCVNLVADYSVFTNNSARQGGGICSNGQYVSYTNCNISDNYASGTGGGMNAFGLTLENCTINNNYASTCSAFIGNNVYANGCIIGYNKISESSTTGASIFVTDCIDGYENMFENCQIIGNESPYILDIRGTQENSAPYKISNCEFIANKEAENGLYGAIINVTSIILENTVFSANFTRGGYIVTSTTAFTQTYSLSITMTGGAISGNVMSGGGVIDTKASEQYPAEVSFDGVSIYGNTDQTGAVLQVGEYTSVSLTNCSVFSNVGAKGGAIGVKNNGNLVLGGGVEFGNNFAEKGSSIYVEDGGVASISNVVFHDMTDTNGVVYTEHGGVLNIIGGEVYNNTGENGSVFYYDGSGVISGVVAYNNSGTNGGVLYVGETGSVTLENIDFYSNSATNGGAVYANGAINFRSGEIRDNTATNGGGVYVGNSGSFSMSYTERLEITGSSDTGQTTTRVGVYGVVDSNTADYGGGVFIAENGSATINGGHKNGQDEDESSTIEGAGVNNNTTNYNGGGVYVSANATLTILGGEVDGNKNTTGAEDLIVYGVGIYSEGAVIINGGYIANNSVNTHIVYGGNISVMGANANLSVNNAYIYHGGAKYGGGLFVGTDALANVKNSLIEKNFCGDYGEGTAFYTNGLTFFDNCTFIENNGHYGMSFISYGCLADLTIKNCYLGPHHCTDYIILTNVFSDAENLAEISLLNSYLDVSAFKIWGIFRMEINGKYFTIDGCEFYSSLDSAQYSNRGIHLDSEYVSVTNSTFNGPNTNLSMTTSKKMNVVISDCEFFNNIVTDSGVFAGQACITQVCTNRDSVVNIHNVYLHDNTGEIGAAAIGVRSVAQTIFSGEIIVENNVTENGHSSVLFGGGSPITVRAGTKFVVDNNEGGNMCLENTMVKNLLEGDLDPESKVCIDLPSDISGEGYYVLGAKNRNYILTSDILDNFYLSDSNFGLRFSEAQNGIVLYDKSENGELSVVVSDKVVVQEVGESYSIEEGDIEVLFSGSAYQGEYSIEYSLTGLEGSWSDTSPSLRAKGEYTIYYKVSADILDEPIVDNVTIKIIGQRIYLKSVPTANLRYGEALSRAVFSGGLVEDEKGQAVAGVWSFSESTTVPSSILTRYTATFTPYNEIYENSNVISVSVSVNISYGVVFYANGGFVTNEKDVNNTYIGINNLSQMVEYMSDNSSIIFTEAYTVIGDVSIVANKNIDFVRHSTFMTGPMIIVDVDSSLTLNGGSGELVFEGAGSLSGRNDFKGGVIDNRGEINLQTNVIFRAFSIIYETVGGDIYSQIRNREGGILRLNGVEIYGNILRSGLSNTGGIIYNEGTLYISGGRFYSNHMDAASSTVTRQGVGGFIYNLGNVYMSGGEIFNNRAELGGAIYIAGGSVRLNGGRIYANQTTNGGGAVCVGVNAELILGATDIYGNFSASGEDGIKNAGGDIFDISLNAVSSEMLAEIENKNYDMGLKFDESGENGDAKNGVGDGVVVGLMFVALVIAFLCVVVIRKRKRNF